MKSEIEITEETAALLFAVACGADGFYRYKCPVTIGKVNPKIIIGTSGGFLTLEEAERAAARDSVRWR